MKNRKQKVPHAICDDCGNVYCRSPKKCKCGCTLFKPYWWTAEGRMAAKAENEKRHKGK